MARLPAPVIVIPGITATYLRDEYTLPPEAVWTVMRKDFARITLHPDDLRYEATEPARVMPDQIYEIAYGELVKELRYNLAVAPDVPVPVYLFGYDWRQPLAQTQRRLADFVSEVIDRTQLLHHYAKNEWAGEPGVNLVGHSMGGLIAAGYIAQAGADAKVEKVVSLASPFRGSFEAVLKITTGTASIGGIEPASREREAARLTPALYHLLPEFKNALHVDAGLADSLFKPEAWQASVLATITHFIKTYGLPDATTAKNRPTAAERAAKVFQSILDEAKSHRSAIERLNLERAGLSKTDWLCVAGADAKTRVALHIRSDRGKPVFDLDSEDRRNHWEDADVTKRVQTGDGTVPLEGAMPGFLGRENVVCVTPEDYGYWEVQDRMVTSVAGFHGILPNMDMLHRLIVRYFTGRTDKNRNTWGRPMPGVSPDDWQPAIDLKCKT